MIVPVVRILPTAAIQCPGHQFVEINAADFDPALHTLYSEGAEADSDKSLKIGDIRAALIAKGVQFDPAAKKADLLQLLSQA